MKMSFPWKFSYFGCRMQFLAFAFHVVSQLISHLIMIYYFLMCLEFTKYKKKKFFKRILNFSFVTLKKKRIYFVLFDVELLYKCVGYKSIKYSERRLLTSGNRYYDECYEVLRNRTFPIRSRTPGPKSLSINLSS